MKKKGLIIATIVMVLVLAVSLTTATYAWFTVSDVTTIDAFTVSVVSDNAVNIGVKIDNTYDAAAATNPDAFMNGTVNYSGTPGALGGGTWADGQVGLGATIDHNIVWGEQKKAVGVSTEATKEAATKANTGLWTQTNGKTAIAANGTVTELVESSKALAVANNDGSDKADYAYLFLGVQAAKTLTTNELVILVDGTNSPGTIVGILGAIHVAYRVDNGAWTDTQVFAEAWDDALADVTCNLTEAQATSYKNSYGVATAPTSKAQAVVIPLNGSLTANGHISQVEIVIYIAGADDDCRNEALNSSGAISIFFNTVAAVQNNG